ncbi:TetR-like C-terminal domain-containing protein [Treponema phagedenis]
MLKNKDVPQDFLINHITCSFTGMIMWWITNGTKERPEKVAEYFLSLIL